jgi:hypothetical protein
VGFFILVINIFMAKFKKLPYSKDWVYSDSILIEAADIILADFKIDYEHDIPYVAGYNNNGNIIYIDKDVYAAIKKEKKEKWLKPLSFHEAIEKSLMMAHPNLEYQFCHQNALRLELELVTAMKIDKKAYDAFMDKYIKKIGDLKEYSKVPRDLDLVPYEDEKDNSVLKKISASKSFVSFHTLPSINKVASSDQE